MLHAYFDFVDDFIKSHYNNFTQDNLIVFMNSLVARINMEQGKIDAKLAKSGKTLSTKKKSGKKGKSNKCNIRINKCWNTIRFIAEHDYFSNNFLSIIEQTLQPLFEYLVDPTKIDFDDDIIFCIISILKKSKSVSPVMAQIFPHLQKFHQKYRYIFGHLLHAINNYIIHGKAHFESSDSDLNLVLEMASKSIFNE